MSTLKERLEEALAAAGFTGLVTERTEDKTRYADKPNDWHDKPEVPAELEIKLSAILGENPEWYIGILPAWQDYQWRGAAIFRFVPQADEEPRNECLRNLPRGTRCIFNPYWLRCGKTLNLDSLDMTWNDSKRCITLYQKHRPFREMHEYGDFQHYDLKMISDVVRTVQALKRVHDLAQPALENVNSTIAGFRAQIKKVKAKNGLLNEREKAKIKQ